MPKEAGPPPVCHCDGVQMTTDPAWCGYPEPARPVSGCWSLLGGKITKPADCDECECKIEEPAND